MRTLMQRIFKILFWSGVFFVTIIMYVFLALSPGLVARSPIYTPRIHVCEEPYIYYTNSHSSRLDVGVIEYDGKQQDFFIVCDEMGNECFWKIEYLPHYLKHRDDNLPDCEDALLFKGDFYHNGKDNFFKISFDNTGIFGENNSKLRFISYNKEEYLRKHGILKLIG